jgi:poly-gamma-glutamate capsule biosynthesis protein CapA/YwtB (metallophosphatase superfamily)
MNRLRATVVAAGAVLLAACAGAADPNPPSEANPADLQVQRPGPLVTATAEPTPQPREFTIVATGDILLHPPLWEQARADAATTGNAPKDFAPQLSAIEPIVAGADLSICHLEVPIAPEGGPYHGYPAFSGPPQIVPALLETGYTACTTASNHTFDQGAAGVDRTLDTLDEAGITAAGSARTADEAAEPTLVEVETAGGPVTVGLVSYTYGFNGIPYPGGEEWRSNLIDQECVRGGSCERAATEILADAEAARQAGAEVVVASMHWGDEYRHEPNATQTNLAPLLISSSEVDLVLGHHAHVVQPMESFDGQWVVYGLGNLMAAHGTPGDELREGLLVRFTLTEDLETGEFATTTAEYLPVYQTYDVPRLVVNVPDAMAGGPAGSESADRLQVAFDRTTEVVGRRGAFDDGLQLLDGDP